MLWNGSFLVKKGTQPWWALIRVILEEFCKSTHLLALRIGPHSNLPFTSLGPIDMTSLDRLEDQCVDGALWRDAAWT